MAKEKRVKKPKSKLRKTIDWIVTCLFAGLFLLVAVFQIMSISSKKTNHGVPSIMGYQTLVVLTDSMEPEYKVGGAVFVKKVDPATLKENDDVTFYYPQWSSYMANPIVTHRLSKITINEDVPVGQGHYTFTVHGINTNSVNCKTTGSEPDCTKQTQVFNETVLLGKVVGYSFFVGGIFKFISSIWGLFILLLIPALYLVVTSVIDIVKAAKLEDDPSPNKENNGSSLDGLTDKDKERLKQELLDNLMSEKGDKKDDSSR